MGFVLSTHTTLSPFSLASVIIGFVSFAFTVSTFLKVVWTNLSTLSEAPHEVHATLTDLRTELLEEKASLRNMRRWCRRRERQHERPERGMELDEISLKTMEDSVRGLVRRFKSVEAPFLEPGEQGIMEASHRSRRRKISISPHYAHSAYGDPPEKRGGGRGWERDTGNQERDDEDPYWAQRTSYASYGLGKRLVWLRKKSEALALVQALSRVQLRRIALQVGGLTMMRHRNNGENNLLEMEEMVRRIDEKMSRFVGVRRIEGDRNQ